MAKREYISKKLRFMVFNRDGFRCRYCGSHPAMVELVLDHVIPVSLGGETSLDNLAACCVPCNQGKGATPIAWTPTPTQSRVLEAIDNANCRHFHRQLRADSVQALYEDLYPAYQGDYAFS